jgi:hypothetical protein
MTAQPVDINVTELRTAIEAFDREFSRMERVVWIVAQECRPALLPCEATPLVSEFVWLVKRWMGVQGLRGTAKLTAAHALANMRLTATDFETHPTYDEHDCDWPSDLVARLV